MATDTTTFEATLKRDRMVLFAGLLTVIAVAWVWLLLGAGMNMTAFEMTGMSKSVGLSSTEMLVMPVEMSQTAIWDASYALLMFTMWWVMMVAMMLPSAAPMLLLFARLNRKEQDRGRPFTSTGIFAIGYVVVWGVFSAAASALQWLLESSGLLSSMMVATNATFGGILLVAAGMWQLTPIKQACLRHCRSPISFISQNWRSGHAGAIHMGLKHGAYCLGCCWFLMGLLFYGGVMNLYWIIGLAAFVLIEKMIPAGHWLGMSFGAVLVGWGVLVLI